jgi:hypothetical protein
MLLTIIDADYGVGRGDLVQTASRAFGLSANGARLKEVLQLGVRCSGAISITRKSKP